MVGYSCITPATFHAQQRAYLRLSCALCGAWSCTEALEMQCHLVNVVKRRAKRNDFRPREWGIVTRTRVRGRAACVEAEGLTSCVGVSGEEGACR